MTVRDLAHTHNQARGDALAIPAVAAMIAVLFAGSTVLTPLYIVYKQQFGFSQITLTLIYAVYVVGNLGALLMFGGVSDVIGRRPAALAAMGIAIGSALVFPVCRQCPLARCRPHPERAWHRRWRGNRNRLDFRAAARG
ncbi:hypothetical protein [Mesorhizobium sp. AR07]|uniref:hypothetical protein n=1 Tax=Mesorhizobium sp. AR07 TaxID=2865838 RepID=UPI002160C70D|nr:hypothetical protein [Mesorhizobium sp. AR07]